MKKLIVTSAIFALLALPLVAAMPALAADVSFDADTTLDLSDPDVDIIVRNGSTVDSITPSTGTISVTMSTDETLTLRSNDRKSMSHNSTFAASFTCSDSYSELTITGGTGSNTFTVSVSSGTCATANSGSSSSSSKAPSTTPAPTTTTETTPAAAETTEATEAAEATTETTPAETTATETTTAEETVAETATAPAADFAKKIVEIISEAAEVIAAKVETIIAKVGATRDLSVEQTTATKYVKPLVTGDSEIAAETQIAMTNFIAYGTPTTKILGAGERAGVLNSFQKAYSKLPETEVDWQDTIKIANGRFPKQQSIEKEKEALKIFGKIYLKMPDFSNSHDEAALKIIAYGIRPTSRNLDSEKFAIRTFKNIYGRNPSDTADWDIMRAIAYSGAKR